MGILKASERLLHLNSFPFFVARKKASALPALHSLLHFLFLASKMDEEVGKPSCKPVKYFDEMFILCMNQSEVSNSF